MLKGIRIGAVALCVLILMGKSTKAENVNISAWGGLSIPVSDLKNQWKFGWDVGSNIYFWPYQGNVGLGLRFAYNRWTPDSNGFTLKVGPNGVSATGLKVDGSASLTELEPVIRWVLPYRNNYFSFFLEGGAGWFHFNSNATATGTVDTVTASQTFKGKFNGFATIVGAGLTFGSYHGIGFELEPVFHYQLSSHTPIAYFTTNLAISMGF